MMCQAIFIVAVAEPFLAGGTRFFKWNHSKKAPIVAVCNGFQASGVHVASLWESMDVFYSYSYKMLSRCIGWISHLQPIVLLSLTLRPANVIHLWIEEDLIYTSVCQVFWFGRSCSCCRGVFGRRRSTFPKGRRYNQSIKTSLNSSHWKIK